MTEILGLEHVGLSLTGPTLSLSVAAGQSLAVVGPAASGKSHLLRTIAGYERPPQGVVRPHGSVALAERGLLSRRVKPLSLVRRPGVPGSAGRSTELLMTMRLWDVRNLYVAELTPSQLAACELLEPLGSGASIILIDGQLDLLDPWTLSGVLARLKDMESEGTCFVVATNRPDLIERFDALVVLKEKQVRFAGPVQDLLRIGAPHTLEVSTQNQPGVRSLVKSFDVRVEQTADGVRMEAAEGQQLAAKLLLEGYGDVRFLVHRPPSVIDTLLGL